VIACAMRAHGNHLEGLFLGGCDTSRLSPRKRIRRSWSREKINCARVAPRNASTMSHSSPWWARNSLCSRFVDTTIHHSRIS